MLHTLSYIPKCVMGEITARPEGILVMMLVQGVPVRAEVFGSCEFYIPFEGAWVGYQGGIFHPPTVRHLPVGHLVCTQNGLLVTVIAYFTRLVIIMLVCVTMVYHQRLEGGEGLLAVHANYTIGS